MPLTDLEHTVLGNVWKKGECSGYEILQEFTHSTAAYYRSREGAIYPLLARLERRRLLRGRADMRGKQARRLFTISPSGVAALRAWLAGPIPAGDATVPADLIRTRIYFLGAIPPGQRRRMVREAAEQVGAQLETNRRKQREFKATGNPFAVLALDGILHAMRARLAWLHRLEKSPLLRAPVTDRSTRRTPKQTTESRRRPPSRRR